MKYWPVFIFLVIGAILIINSTIVVSPSTCSSYTTQSTCEASSSCQWKSDNWGSWCEEKGCWNFWNQSACANSVNTINKSCNWKNSTSSGWCSQISCWVFSGTSSSACTNNSYGLTCFWEQSCQGPGNCWQITDQTSCTSTPGCEWGNCYQAGCWSYTTQATCTASTSKGYNGKPCKWNSESSYCYETSCWDYSANQTACTANNCTWSGGSCTEIYCPRFDYTNSSACINNTAGLSCDWSSPYCNSKGCWSYTTQATCNAANTTTQGCYWEVSQNSGWCEQVGCWNFDNWSLGALANQTACENNTAGLDCVWDQTGGWCYQNYTALSCSGITNEFDCYDTYYCWWDGSSCKNPGGGTIFDTWNPGCYIFDLNQTACGNVTGCSWSADKCTSNATIKADGLRCEYINTSSLCNTIPVFSSCCTWLNGTCTTDTWSTSCRDSLTAPPAGANFCEDYNAYDSKSLCEQIANYPWFMPCKWNNNTLHCQFNDDDVFGGGGSLENINNKKSCEAAGGRWIFETYCEGNQSIPAGRCELKFDGETNCNKACFACEKQSDGTAWASLADAKSACESSALGFCEFKQDTRAYNGLGFCNPKSEFKDGLFKDCNSDCTACTFMGDILEGEPQQACKTSKANCDWFTDPLDSTKGWCASKSQKSCEEDCTRCYDQTSCNQKGRGGNGSCSWDSSSLLCMPSAGSQNIEICFDGTDNDGDGNYDCSDSECYSDPFCGGGTGFNCFGYTTQSSCTGSSEGCVWINETWGAWCDVPGANCWKNDGNQAGCQLLNATCEWHTSYGGGFCDVNMTLANQCIGLNNSACTITANCTWVVDKWCQNVGGWCGGDYSLNCWQYQNTSSCSVASGCSWTADSWCAGNNTGWCDYTGFSCWQHQNSSACTSNNCNWHADQYSYQGGWCEGPCFNSNLNQSTCESNGCLWRNGFCDPKGFGTGGTGGGGMGFTCYKFNGNQTACVNQTGCSFVAEPFPFCDIDFGSDCKQYFDNTTCSNQTLTGGKCKWNPSGNYCDDLGFECYWNASLQGSESNCERNNLCTWNSGNSYCEPSCFNSTLNNNATACSATLGCKWASGWCDSSLVAQHFDEITSGDPQPLGTDACGSGSADASIDDWVDICGFGMKDLVDAYGFGIKVSDFSQSAICNGLKLISGGFGAGNKSAKYYFYLDTNGNTTGNCNLAHNSSSMGWEFYFKYEASWNNNTASVSEAYTAYKCVDGQWGVADIPLTGDRRTMCDQIQGPIIGIEKESLNRFQNLYTSAANLRVYVSAANETANISSPSDTSGPGYATPGSIDFKTECCWDIGADCDADNILAGSDPDCSDINRQGFIKYEECFSSGIDEDADGLVDCYDTDCKYFQYCVDNQLGVNSPGYVDTESPKVMAIKIEEYLDSALISYDTNEPADGRLFFYRNDSTCTTLNRTIFDVGINITSVRGNKTWHIAEIYDDGGIYSINYNLSINTTYYYKLQVCDPSGNCATSACLNFKTPSTPSTCGFCNFTARLKAPSGWTVSYDVDQDGTYEHIQGQVCGTNAGMKATYSDGRRVNIKMSNGTTYIEFFNASLTKGMLNDKVRTFSDANDVKGGSTTDASGGNVYYTGLASDVRDQIVNSLHPQRCRIKIPGTSNSLWHCMDNLTSCTQRTDATLIESGSDYRIWDIPYCEFSIWAGGQPGTQQQQGSGGGSGGGGGGGAGGAAPKKCTEGWSCTEWSECTLGSQKRTCTDTNKCNASINKPPETQNCVRAFCGNGICEPGESYASCPADCPSVAEACNPGERRCLGNVVQICNEEGTVWLTLKACPYECENGECTEPSLEGGNEGLPVPVNQFSVIIAVVVAVLAFAGIYFKKKMH